MFTLTINNTKLTGVIALDASRALDGVCTPGRLTLVATRQASYDNWYDQFLRNKANSMLFGGTLVDDELSDAAYSFSSNDKYPQDCLKTIQHSGGNEDGSFYLLPSKTVDVSVDAGDDSSESTDNAVYIGLPSKHISINKLYYEVYLLTWRLYHALNSIAGRLLIFDPSIPYDGSLVGIAPKRFYLGSALNYQALAARWNFHAWYESFTFYVVEAGERLSIVVGYTNLNCKASAVSYSVTIHYAGTDAGSDSASTVDPPGADEKVTWSHVLTIYDQGVDSNIGKNGPVINTVFYRNGQYCSGSGYEGRTASIAGDLTYAAMTTLITATAGKPAMLSEQYHRNIVAIAPCIGIDEEHIVQRGNPTVFHNFNITAEWDLGGAEPYKKTKRAKVAATGFFTKRP